MLSKMKLKMEKGIDVSVTNLKTWRKTSKNVQVANQQIPTRASTPKACLGNYKSEDVGLVRPTIAKVAALFA